MIDGQQNFEEHDGSGIDSDSNQDNTFLCFSGHKEVDIEEDKSQDSIVEQPVGDEGYFFDQICMDSFSIVTFGSPRDVINITEGIDQHDMRIGTLIDHVADWIEEQFEHKTGMSWQMHECNNKITSYVDAGNNKH